MTAATAGEAPRKLLVYRDDGPVAEAVGRLSRGIGSVPPALLVLAGALPLFALIAIEGDGASDLAVGLALGWLILAAGVSSGQAHDDRFRWLALPLLRVAEYSALIWIGAIAGGDGMAAAFALLCALALRHYDLVYRLRHQGAEPPRWVGIVSGGWAGRLIVVYVLLVAGALPAGLFVMAGVLGAVFVAESAASWLRADRVEATEVYEDEEEEDAAE